MFRAAGCKAEMTKDGGSAIIPDLEYIKLTFFVEIAEGKRKTVEGAIKSLDVLPALAVGSSSIGASRP